MSNLAILLYFESPGTGKVEFIWLIFSERSLTHSHPQWYDKKKAYKAKPAFETHEFYCSPFWQEYASVISELFGITLVPHSFNAKFQTYFNHLPDKCTSMFGQAEFSLCISRFFSLAHTQAEGERERATNSTHAGLQW